MFLVLLAMAAAIVSVIVFNNRREPSPTVNASRPRRRRGSCDGDSTPAWVYGGSSDASPTACSDAAGADGGGCDGGGGGY